MAIILTPSIVRLAAVEYFHTKKQFPVVKSFSIDAAACCFGNCEMPLPVFADLANETISRNNDFSKFIVKVPTGATVVCTVTNLDTNTDYIITDATYGIFADVGDLAAEPLVWAFVLNWFKIANLISFGNYRINITIENLSGTEIFNQDTPCYYLRPYECESASGTVRFQVLQSGYVQNGFDYRSFTGLAGFFRPQQIRVYGSIDKTPITTTDYISNSESENIQVQKGIHHEWVAEAYHLSGQIYDLFFKDLLLENPITVNTYNVFDSEVLEEHKMSFLTGDKRPKNGGKEEFISLTLEDNEKGTKKRY